MIIRINEKYKIHTDSLNLILERKAKPKKDDKDCWILVGYYSNFEHLYKSLVLLEILSDKELEGFKDIKKAMNKVYESIEESLADVNIRFKGLKPFYIDK